VAEYVNDFNKPFLKLPKMNEDEKIYMFISGFQAEVKLQVLHCPNDLQTATEIEDRADTIIFQAKRFSRGRGGPTSEPASRNWPNQGDEAMKLGVARLTDSEREKYMKDGKCFRCGQKGHRANQHNADGSPPKTQTARGMQRQGTKKFTEREQKHDRKTTKRNVPPHCILGTTH
jgi:hypothetical protein